MALAWTAKVTLRVPPPTRTPAWKVHVVPGGLLVGQDQPGVLPAVVKREP